MTADRDKCRKKTYGAVAVGAGAVAADEVIVTDALLIYFGLESGFLFFNLGL